MTPAAGHISRDDDLKSLLKWAASNPLPDAILNHSKRDFVVPIRVWFVDALGGEIRRTLDSFIGKGGLFIPAEGYRMPTGGQAREAWHLFNCVLWASDYGGAA